MTAKRGFMDEYGSVIGGVSIIISAGTLYYAYTAIGELRAEIKALKDEMDKMKISINGKVSQDALNPIKEKIKGIKNLEGRVDAIEDTVGDFETTLEQVKKQKRQEKKRSVSEEVVNKSSKKTKKKPKVLEDVEDDSDGLKNMY